MFKKISLSLSISKNKQKTQSCSHKSLHKEKKTSFLFIKITALYTS
jgi:hypothetical protein